MLRVHIAACMSSLGGCVAPIPSQPISAPCVAVVARHTDFDSHIIQHYACQLLLTALRLSGACTPRARAHPSCKRLRLLHTQPYRPSAAVLLSPPSVHLRFACVHISFPSFCGGRLAAYDSLAACHTWHLPHVSCTGSGLRRPKLAHAVSLLHAFSISTRAEFRLCTVVLVRNTACLPKDA